MVSERQKKEAAKKRANEAAKRKKISSEAKRLVDSSPSGSYNTEGSYQVDGTSSVYYGLDGGASSSRVDGTLPGGNTSCKGASSCRVDGTILDSFELRKGTSLISVDGTELSSTQLGEGTSTMRVDGTSSGCNKLDEGASSYRVDGTSSNCNDLDEGASSMRVDGTSSDCNELDEGASSYRVDGTLSDFNEFDEGASSMRVDGALQDAVSSIRVDGAFNEAASSWQVDGTLQNVASFNSQIISQHSFEPMDVDVSDSASETSNVSESMSDLCPQPPKKGKLAKKSSKRGQNLINLNKARSIESLNDSAAAVDHVESSPQFAAPLQPAKRGRKPKVKAPTSMRVVEQTAEQIIPAINAANDRQDQWWREIDRDFGRIELNDPGHNAPDPLFQLMEDLGCAIVREGGTNMAQVDAQELSVDHRQMMTSDSLYIYLCYLATINKRNVAVMHYRNANQFNDDITLNNFGMTQNPIDVLLIPIVFPGHFAIAMYRPGRNAVFYDSLPRCNRLTPDVVDYIQRAVNITWPLIAPEQVQVERAPAVSYNTQDDGYNCGFYTSIYAELYLIDPNHMHIYDFGIAHQRQRIVDMLSELGESHVPYYISPEAEAFEEFPEETGIFDDSDLTSNDGSVVEDVQNLLTPTTSQESVIPIVQGTSSERRRSTRIANSPSVNLNTSRTYTPRGQNKAPKLKPFFNCKKNHGNRGCFAISANHKIDYYDVGNIGDKVCPHCGALLFESESFASCCQDGQVQLNDISEWPIELQALAADPAKGRLLKKDFRKYNDLLRFGSYQATRATVSSLYPQFQNGRHPPVILMNGEIQHHLNNIFVKPGESPVFGQFYIIDPNDTAPAIQNNPNVNYFGLDVDICKSLLDIIRRKHILGRAYESLYDQYLREKNNAIAQGLPDVPHVQLTLLSEDEIPQAVRDAALHPRQVNLPQNDREICAIHVASDFNEPPQRHGFCMRLKPNPANPHAPRNFTLKFYSRHYDCASWPLLFPNGDPGYRLNIPKRAKIAPPANNAQLPALSNADYDPEDNEEFPDEEIEQNINEDVDTKHVSIRAYYRYHLALRKNKTGAGHFLWQHGDIAQEFLLDQSFRVDQQVFSYLRKQSQLGLLCVTSEDVRQCIAAGLKPGEELGKVFKLPVTMIGTPAWYNRKYEHAMQMFHQKGRPTFMLTSTVNPNWPEIKRHRESWQTQPNRPDDTNRVYFRKLKKMRKLIEKKAVFGEVQVMLESLEYQKRGPPHSHKLISILNAEHTAEFVDDYISAEIPAMPDANDQSDWAKDQRRLRELVLKFQTHNCSSLCKKNNNGKCRRNYPKPYAQYTIVHHDKETVYRRRSEADGGEVGYTYDKKGNVIGRFTNADIVPYSPTYMLAWEGHHNMEYCYGVAACRYAVKYHLKGGDYAYLRQGQTNTNIVDYDEGVMLMKASYRSSHEAHARLYDQKIVRMDHNVVSLHVHLPGQAPQYFRRTTELQQIIAKSLCRDDGQDKDIKYTQFEQYMLQCSKHRKVYCVPAQNCICRLLFQEVPRHYIWHPKKRVWQARKRQRRVIGFLYPVYPNEPDRFALYQLVLHRRGMGGYHEWCTLPDGRVFLKPDGTPDYIGAAIALGLIDDASVWNRTLVEAELTLSPRKMRQLFAQILLSQFSAGNYAQLWQDHIRFMYVGGNTIPNMTAFERNRREQIALYVLDRLLARQWQNTTVFGLPAVDPLIAQQYQHTDPDHEFFFGGDFDSDLRPDLTDTSAGNAPQVAPAYHNPTQYQLHPSYLGLNAEQQSVIDKVFAAFRANVSDKTVPRLILMTGSGGTGKTHVYKVLVELCQLYEFEALVTATTGVAATLLPMGTTLHSALRLPRDNITSDMTANIKLNSTHARRLNKARLLIIDEVSMLDRTYLSIINNTLHNILPVGDTRRAAKFGGKVVLLGGDFQQLLPVISGGGLGDQMQQSIRFSEFFNDFDRVYLTQNMRVGPNQQQFVQTLDQVGRDQNQTGQFAVPANMLATDMQHQIDFVYDNGRALHNPAQLQNCLLLAPKRRDVDELNMEILCRFNPQVAERLFWSSDTEMIDSPLNAHIARHDVQMLQRETPSGMPPHELRLKEGAVVVLLRNIDVYRGLSNGTRMTINTIGDELLHCTIVAGPYKNKRCVLSKYCFEYNDKRINGTRLHFKRVQFPIQLAFAMTINKAQGQTVDRLGLYLQDPVFSHGQLYVALSRVRSGDSVTIFVGDYQAQIAAGQIVEIRNIVMQSVLDPAP